MSKNISLELNQFAIDLFKIGCIKFGQFKTKIGLMSPIYLDLRLIVCCPILLDKLADLFLQKIKENCADLDQVCGVPYTALPIATLISVKNNTSMLIRRREVKSHGTMKMIEGKYNDGDECVIIEDVITSGSSVLETIQDLKKEKLQVKNVFIVVDREQGGVNYLTTLGYNVYSLFTITQLLCLLHENKLIDEETVDKVSKYIKESQIDYNKTSVLTEKLKNPRLTQTFEERAKLCKSKTGQKLFSVMCRKQSMLCLAADVQTARELIKIADDLGPYICLLKTHHDIVRDFNSETVVKLKQLALKHDFLIFEDRKFADIGSIVSQQLDKISNWCDVVTVHALTGNGVIQGLRSCTSADCGCFIVAEMSCGNVTDQSYVKKAADLAVTNSDLVIGLVNQTPDLLTEPGLLQLTPGVRLNSTTDGLDQNYIGPVDAVLSRGADVVVVGRGIINNDDPVSVAKIYVDQLWTSYLSRVDGKS